MTRKKPKYPRKIARKSTILAEITHRKTRGAQKLAIQAEYHPICYLRRGSLTRFAVKKGASAAHVAE
jgi:hypothetical protein